MIYYNPAMPAKIGYGLSLDDVETWLFGGVEPGAVPAFVNQGGSYEPFETLPKGDQDAIADMIERLRKLGAKNPAAFAVAVQFVTANMDEGAGG